MPPWYLPLLAQGIETTLSKLSKTRLGTIHNLPERERESESKDEKVCEIHSFLSCLLTWTQPLNISGTREFSFHMKILRQQNKIYTGKGIPVPPPSPKPFMAKSRSLWQPGCLCNTCLSQPLFHLHSHSLPDGRLQSSPSLVSLLPSGIPPIQPLSGAPNTLWDSCSPLTEGKAPWASFFPSILGLDCMCHMHETMEMQHMSWDFWWLSISLEIHLKTIRRMTYLEQNPEKVQNGALVAGIWCRNFWADRTQEFELS